MRIKTVLVLIIVIALGASGFFLMKGKLSFGRSQGGAFYAVHLSNGQVYFGHLASVSPETIVLSDTHFLELYEQKGDTVATSSNFSLQEAPKQIYQIVKRGSDKTLTTDHTLYINRATVLFWEKLTSDSDVVAMIAKEK